MANLMIGGIVLAAVSVAAYTIWKNRKAGKCCGGSCASCGGACPNAGKKND